MKKRVLFLLTAALLAGCAAPPAETTVPPFEITTPQETQLETAPPASPRPAAERVAQLDTAPLPVIAPEERFRFTSAGCLVETEDGYYTIPYLSHTLFYADKRDITNWTVVCNRPDCAHKNNCPAQVGSAIWERDGNLYALLDQSVKNPILAQVGRDGSGLTPAYSDPDFPIFQNKEISWSVECAPDGFCFNVCQMENDGNMDSFLYFVDENGSHKLDYAQDFPDFTIPYTGNTANRARGDLTMLLPQTYEEAAAADPCLNLELLYRITPDSAEPLNLPEGCSYFGAYLSGDTMVHYHPNEGFYRLDIPSGKEVKVQDAAYEDAFGYCLDGTFLVETNVCFQSTHTENAVLRYFDGESWTEVSLPPEITPDKCLDIWGLTSEYLFFTNKFDGRNLYAVKLGETQMVKCLEYDD